MLHINDIQAEILSPDCKVSDLLRLFWQFGKNRKDAGICQWAEHELFGYPPGPTYLYRMVKGQLYSGTPLVPVPFTDDTMELQTAWSTHPVMQSVGYIESFACDPGSTTMSTEVPPDVARLLPLGQNALDQVPRVLCIADKPAIGAVLDYVRTMMWMWAYTIDRDDRKPRVGFTAASR